MEPMGTHLQNHRPADSASLNQGLAHVLLQQAANAKGPCTHIAYTLVPKYLNRDYMKANVYTIWLHGPLGEDGFFNAEL